jgi:folate-binding Fe-S cluster repair protein YgfZ
MASAILPDRGVIELVGEEAGALLDRLVTSEVDGVASGHASFAALLTPQGKIIADFVVFKVQSGTFFLDCAADCIGDLIKRLTMYRLRAKVTIVDAGERFAIAWAGPGRPCRGRRRARGGSSPAGARMARGGSAGRHGRRG